MSWLHDEMDVYMHGVVNIDAQLPKQYHSLLSPSCITTTVNQQADEVVCNRHVPYLADHRYATRSTNRSMCACNQ